MENTLSRIAISTMLLITMGVAPIQEGGATGGPEEYRGCDCGRRHHGSCRGGIRQHASSARQSDVELFGEALKKIGAQDLAYPLHDRGIRNVEQLKRTHPDFLAAWGIPQLTRTRAERILFLLNSGLPVGEPRGQSRVASSAALGGASLTILDAVEQESPDNDEKCCVCYGNKDLREFECGHSDPICVGCFRFIQQGNNKCPLCRKHGPTIKRPQPTSVEGVLKHLGLLKCAGALADKGYEYLDLVMPELKPEHLAEDTGINIQHARHILIYARQLLQEKLDSLDFKDALAAKGYQLLDLQRAEPDELINEIGLTTEQARRLVTTFYPKHPFGTVKHQKLFSRSNIAHEASQEYVGYVEYTIQRDKDKVWRQTDIKGVDSQKLEAIIPGTRKQPSSFWWQESQRTEIPAVEIMRAIMAMVERTQGYPVDEDEWDSTLFEYGKGNWVMIRCEFPLEDEDDDHF